MKINKQAKTQMQAAAESVDRYDQKLRLWFPTLLSGHPLLLRQSA